MPRVWGPVDRTRRLCDRPMDSVAGRAMQGMRHRLRRRFHGPAWRLGTASRTGTVFGLSGAPKLSAGIYHDGTAGYRCVVNASNERLGLQALYADLDRVVIGSQALIAGLDVVTAGRQVVTGLVTYGNVVGARGVVSRRGIPGSIVVVAGQGVAMKV